MWWFILNACSGPSVEVEAAFDAQVANVLRVDVALPARSRARVIWGEGEVLHHSTPWSDAALSHQLWVTDLPHESTIQWAVQTDSTQTEAQTAEVPSTGIPSVTVTDHDPDASEMTSGRVLVSITDEEGSGLAILDAEGQIRWGLLYPSDRTSAHPFIAQNGTDLLALAPRRDRLVNDIQLWRTPIDGSGERRVTQLPTAHHMVAELPDGDLAWLGLDAAPVDISSLSLAEPEWLVMADTLWRGPETQNGEETGSVLWSYLDDWPHEFFLPCEHLQMLEDRLSWTDVHEWTHSNSLVYLPSQDELWLGTRLHDSLLAFDAETGEQLWEMGGQHSDFTVDDPWSHGHFSDAWPGGVLIFDNGSHHDPPSSRVVQYDIDAQAREATASRIWDLGGFSAFLGDARRLPGGNILVATGQTSTLLELTPEGEVVWRAVLPGQVAVGRIQFLESLSPIVVGVAAP